MLLIVDRRDKERSAFVAWCQPFCLRVRTTAAVGGPGGRLRAMPRRPFALCCVLVARVTNALIPAEQLRHEQLTATQAAFSRFSADGIGGTIDRQDLPNFLRYVVASMNTAMLPQQELSARSSELTQQLIDHLPAHAVQLSVTDIMQAADKVLITPSASTDDEMSSERGRLGSKQLRLLRKKLERNRLTMPLFDTKGWVRDFEKALKIQWEIYANGLSPMHIVVARSDRIYGLEVLTGMGEVAS